MKPEFWKDSTIAGLAPAVRLTYIGLWMLADDGGWFRADVPEMALELYGWEPRARRERAITAALDALEKAGRIVRQDCGHAQVPTLAEHQKFGGETRRVYTITREHDACSRVPALPRVSPRVAGAVGKGKERVEGTERKGTVVARATDPDGSRGELTEFQRRVPREVIA